MLACHITLSNRFCMHCLLNWSVHFVTKLCSTHTKCDWSLYCLVCVWYANFIKIWRSNRCLYYDFRPLAEAKCHTVWKMIVITGIRLQTLMRLRDLGILRLSVLSDVKEIVSNRYYMYQQKANNLRDQLSKNNFWQNNCSRSATLRNTRMNTT